MDLTSTEEPLSILVNSDDLIPLHFVDALNADINLDSVALEFSIYPDWHPDSAALYTKVKENGITVTEPVAGRATVELPRTERAALGRGGYYYRAFIIESGDRRTDVKRGILRLI
jgi:hypothetical protein